MKLFLILLVVSCGVIGFAFGDTFDNLKLLLPNERDLSAAPWQLGQLNGIQNVKIPFSEETPNVLIRQYGIKGDSGISFLKVKVDAYEFSSSYAANSTNVSYATSIVSQGFTSVPIDANISGHCFAFVAHPDLDDEQSMISCDAKNFLVVITSEQHKGKVFISGKQFPSDLVALQFAKFSMSQILPDSGQSLPPWIKNNAAWWSQNKISDDDFAKGLEYMINQGIISIPDSTSSEPSETKIPSWVKNNAAWWAEGKILDSEFLKSIQYLVSSGIIQVHLKA